MTAQPPRFHRVHVSGFKVSDAWFPPHFDLPPHEHADPIFAVFLDGSMEVSFARRRYDCARATVQVHPAGERHSQRYHGSGARILVVEPGPANLEAANPLRELLTRIGHFRHAGIADLARRAVREMRAPDAVSDLALEALVLEMLAIAARVDARRGPSARAPAWVERVLDLVHDGFRQKLAVQDVADAVDVPAAELAKAFRERYGLPLGSYVRRLRLDWASARLAETRQPLSAVALEAGFYDQSHFTRAFKAYHGLTPGRYRELHAHS
ncbi:MAG: helix-turn-helix domain-containing protein [Gemmatimonadota bacterium]